MDEPKFYQPYADLPYDEYRPSQTIKHDAEVQRVLRTYEDQIFAVRKMLRDIKVPLGAAGDSAAADMSVEVVNKIATDAVDGKPACQPTSLGNPKSIPTGLTNCHDLATLNEFTYLKGDDGTDGKLQVYRIESDNSYTLVGTLTTTDNFTRMKMQGQYLYGVARDAGQLLTIISIAQPNAPVEISTFDVGFVTWGLDVAGRFVYVVGVDTVAVIDASVPSAPAVFGTSS